MAMDVKGIAWVGNVYQKFENMCLEMEEMMVEDTVKYLEDQMQVVGENVKKIYAGVMKDLLPLSLCDLDENDVPELLIDHHSDDGSFEMTSQGSEKITIKADAKETEEDSRVNFDANAVSEIASLASDTRRCTTSSQVKSPASDALCCDEIESSSTEQIYNAPASVKPAEEKEMSMTCSSSSVLFGDTDGFSLIRSTEADDYSHDTVVVSHTEAWSSDATMIDTMQQDDEKNLDETCVMVTKDELRLAPESGGNLETNKKKRRQPFLLSKKSARKQEYKELMTWHGNNDEEKGDDVVKNSCPSSVEDHKKSELPDISEPEWEFL